ncbi:MAG: radical SAM protein, partial [Candidatus Omnitrophota bacterium]
GVERLVEKTIALKKGTISQSAFYTYLVKKSLNADIDLAKQYPNLLRFKDYIARFDAVDKVELFKDLKNIEDKIADRIAKTEEERELFRLFRRLAILRSLFSVTLTSGECLYYKENREIFSAKQFVSFIQREAARRNIHLEIPKNINRLDAHAKKASDFYRYSYKRDSAFMRRIHTYIQGKDRAVFVSDGFHAENMKELLKKSGYSYVVIMPAMEIEEETPYFRLLAGGVSRIEAMVRENMSALAIMSPLTGMEISKNRENFNNSVDAVAKIESGKSTTELLRSSPKGERQDAPEAKPRQSPSNMLSAERTAQRENRASPSGSDEGGAHQKRRKTHYAPGRPYRTITRITGEVRDLYETYQSEDGKRQAKELGVGSFGEFVRKKARDMWDSALIRFRDTLSAVERAWFDELTNHEKGSVVLGFYCEKANIPMEGDILLFSDVVEDVEDEETLEKLVIAGISPENPDNERVTERAAVKKEILDLLITRFLPMRPERDRRIFATRYSRIPPVTFEEIAKHFGISESFAFTRFKGFLRRMNSFIERNRDHISMDDLSIRDLRGVYEKFAAHVVKVSTGANDQRRSSPSGAESSDPRGESLPVIQPAAGQDTIAMSGKSSFTETFARRLFLKPLGDGSYERVEIAFPGSTLVRAFTPVSTAKTVRTARALAFACRERPELHGIEDRSILISGSGTEQKLHPIVALTVSPQDEKRVLCSVTPAFLDLSEKEQIRHMLKADIREGAHVDVMYPAASEEEEKDHAPRALFISFRALPYGSGLVRDALIRAGLRGDDIAHYHATEYFPGVREAIERHRPDIIIFSPLDDELIKARKLIDKIKKEFPQINIAIGGSTVNSAPEQSLALLEDVNLEVRGNDAEKAAEAIKIVASKRADRDLSLSDVNRLKEAEVHGLFAKRGAVSFVHHLDRANFSSRTILPQIDDDFIERYLKSKYIHISSSLGCPHLCHFCDWSYKPRGDFPYLTVPLREVYDWLLRVEEAFSEKGRKTPAINFIDDNFFENHERDELVEFFTLLGSHKKDGKPLLEIHISGVTITSFMSDGEVDYPYLTQLAPLMREAGVDSIAFGLDAVKNEDMRRLRKAQHTLSQALEINAILRMAGIDTENFLILTNQYTSGINELIENIFRYCIYSNYFKGVNTAIFTAHGSKYTNNYVRARPEDFTWNKVNYTELTFENGRWLCTDSVIVPEVEEFVFVIRSPTFFLDDVMHEEVRPVLYSRDEFKSAEDAHAMVYKLAKAFPDQLQGNLADVIEYVDTDLMNFYTTEAFQKMSDRDIAAKKRKVLRKLKKVVPAGELHQRLTAAVEEFFENFRHIQETISRMRHREGGASENITPTDAKDPSSSGVQLPVKFSGEQDNRRSPTSTLDRVDAGSTGLLERKTTDLGFSSTAREITDKLTTARPPIYGLNSAIAEQIRSIPDRVTCEILIEEVYSRMQDIKSAEERVPYDQKQDMEIAKENVVRALGRLARYIHSVQWRNAIEHELSRLHEKRRRVVLIEAERLTAKREVPAVIRSLKNNSLIGAIRSSGGDELKKMRRELNARLRDWTLAAIRAQDKERQNGVSGNGKNGKRDPKAPPIASKPAAPPVAKARSVSDNGKDAALPQPKYTIKSPPLPEAPPVANKRPIPLPSVIGGTDKTVWLETIERSSPSADEFDPRPVDAGLLHNAFVRHDMEVKKIVNPRNEPKVAVYGGAGADVSNFLLSTNAPTGYFVSHYNELSVDDLKQLKSYKEMKDREEYCEWKFLKGFTINGDISIKVGIIAALAFELEAMGIDLANVSVDSDGGHPRISFPWAYQGSQPQEYSITFVDTDMTDPSSYPPRLVEVLDGEFDIYYQRAGNNIANAYRFEARICFDKIARRRTWLNAKIYAQAKKYIDKL